MQRPQLELWSAEPHLSPPIYQQLTPEQRAQLVLRLAQLMVRAVQPQPDPNPPSDHEQ